MLQKIAFFLVYSLEGLGPKGKHVMPYLRQASGLELSTEEQQAEAC